jgi:hypothetical protein
MYLDLTLVPAPNPLFLPINMPITSKFGYIFCFRLSSSARFAIPTSATVQYLCSCFPPHFNSVNTPNIQWCTPAGFHFSRTLPIFAARFLSKHDGDDRREGRSTQALPMRTIFGRVTPFGLTDGWIAAVE